MRNGQDDISSFPTRVDVCMRLGGTLQRIAAIDDWPVFASFSQCRKKAKICYLRRRDTGDDFLAARLGWPLHPQALGKRCLHQKQPTPMRERLLATGKRGRAGRVENDVVGLSVLGEIFV